jgi:RNA polymerase sigma factor (sigma-70 family)
MKKGIVHSHQNQRKREVQSGGQKDELPLLRMAEHRYKLLTVDDFNRLFHACHHAPDERERIRARTLIACSNLGLVISISNEYVGRGVPLADLVQEGSIALFTSCIDNFKPSMGCLFSTYASWWIRQAMGRVIIDTNPLKPMRIPVHAASRMTLIVKARNAFHKFHGHQPDFDELLLTIHGFDTKTAREMTPKQLQRLLHSDPGLSLSTDTFHGSDGDNRTFMESFRGSKATPEAETLKFDALLEMRALKTPLKIAIHSLKSQRSNVLALRYGLAGDPAMTLGEIGEKFGLSRERIRQIVDRALYIIGRALKMKPSDVGSVLAFIGEVSDGPILTVDLSSLPPQEPSAIPEGDTNERLLEDHFTVLAEHATNWRERDEYIILEPRRTLIARKRFISTVAAEKCIETFIAKGWIEQVIIEGEEAAKLLRLDKLILHKELDATDDMPTRSGRPSCRKQRRARHAEREKTGK